MSRKRRQRLIWVVCLSFGLQVIGLPETYYIDPAYQGAKNGSQSQPYSSWKDIIWKDGNTYLFKRGSILQVNYKLRPEANNITIGAYGSGNRPLFKSTVDSNENVLDLGALKNVLIQDIEIQSTNHAATCLQFFKSFRGALVNCKIHGGKWGVRNVLSTGNFRIINCEIYQTDDDGVFISDIDSIEVSSTWIHLVNQNFFINHSEKFSGGDCLQIVNVKYFSIHHNKLDHAKTGNKFCFISSSTIPTLISTGVIKDNLLTRDSTDTGDLIYLTGSENVVISHNIFQNGCVGIYNYSKNPKIYYNVFTHQKTASIYSFSSADSETRVYNNTFVKVNSVILIMPGKGTLKNNIIYRTKSKIYPGGNIPVSDYNCFYPGGDFGTAMNIGTNSIIRDPEFVYEDTGNYRLKEKSPCIGKGIPISDATFSYPFADIAAVPVYKSPVTMGAFEYHVADSDLLKIYPNPNDGRFVINFLTFLQSDVSKILITDTQGKTIYTSGITADKNFIQFDFSNLKSGVYEISVNYFNRPSITKKILISKGMIN